MERAENLLSAKRRLLQNCEDAWKQSCTNPIVLTFLDISIVCILRQKINYGVLFVVHFLWTNVSVKTLYKKLLLFFDLLLECTDRGHFWIFQAFCSFKN